MNLFISHPVIWLIVLVTTLIVEALTAGLVTIWFSAGAIAALISSYFGIGFIYQIIIFIAVSAFALLITRPLVKGKIIKSPVKTNADLVLGQNAVVIEAIEPIEGKGQVKVGGKVWSAKSADLSGIEKDRIVTVEKIEGVHLIVK